jgi:hypothetical protein
VVSPARQTLSDPITLSTPEIVGVHDLGDPSIKPRRNADDDGESNPEPVANDSSAIRDTIRRTNPSIQPSLPQVAGSDTRDVRPAPRGERPSTGAESSSIINLQLLSARVEAFNLRFKAIESSLTELGQLGSAELVELQREIDVLLSEHRMYSMYWNLLSDMERNRVPALLSPDSIVSVMRQRISDARQWANNDANEDAIGKLNEISRRLDTWQDN